MSADHPPSPRALPTLNAFTLLRGLFRRRRRTSGARTPRSAFVLDAIDPARVQRYRQALGFPASAEPAAIPLTFYYLLAQRAQVATMLDPAFPFRLAGTVHAENALHLGAPHQPALPLGLNTTVAIRPPNEKGAVYATLETLGEQDGHTVFTCRSTYLVVRGGRGGHGRTRPPDTSLPPVAAWRLAAASGRAYARLSGDWNPIHLWRWSANLMGMKRPIIHGMHTLGRACAELERAGGRPLAALDARFKAPAALGSELALGADLAGGTFAVRCGERTVAEGRFSLGAPDA
ncbi:MaoC/PaaZ C-terminal domain-containing protein [Herbaspirillum sp. SJZ107]|uniref:MaoC/PaaZ C-terminal domain-containing protein n=1 Tax=Herbaspirillum sp. SJZ107 TaxID=2572881 RepID=UPI00114DC4AF|nr:MaoC/PaaZ C-terminal domain-containing protein [Herbaspirillum sp. SJZ107]TQK11712.1 MaoC dehydratase-like protein [Herbaspirillum sp. SJZ107]